MAKSQNMDVDNDTAYRYTFTIFIPKYIFLGKKPE